MYHGLGLEPWVDGALADVENDNLIVAETHAVADGSQTLLFNEIMINTLCSDLSSLGTQDIHILHETMYFMEELHSDDAAYNMGMQTTMTMMTMVMMIMMTMTTVMTIMMAMMTTVMTIMMTMTNTVMTVMMTTATMMLTITAT